MRRITSITVAATAIAAGLSLAIPGGPAQAARSAPPARAAAHGAALPVIKVAMNGKKITVSGALQSGGVNVVSTVTGEPAGAPTFIRLNRGVTVAQLLKAVQGDPNNVALIASIVFSPPANKGTSSAQASLAPGRYVALDATSRTPPLTTFTMIITEITAPSIPKIVTSQRVRSGSGRLRSRRSNSHISTSAGIAPDAASWTCVLVIQ